MSRDRPWERLFDCRRDKQVCEVRGRNTAGEKRSQFVAVAVAHVNKASEEILQQKEDLFAQPGLNGVKLFVGL